MTTPIEVVEHKGFKINVFIDEDPMHPRRDCENLGHMICFHRKYDLGDKGGIPDLSPGDFDGWNAMQKFLEQECGGVIVLPLFLYDHGGITMSVGSFSDPWDSGQVGFIYATRDEVLKEYGRKKLSAGLLRLVTERLNAEVQEYDCFLRGAVYGYTITAPNGEQTDDSCWGFVGDTRYMIEECKRSIDVMLAPTAETEPVDAESAQ